MFKNGLPVSDHSRNYRRHLCRNVQPPPVGGGGVGEARKYLIWPHLFPHNAGSRPELSPSFAAAASVRDVRMIEVSPHKITPTQLLHCHTELSQAADLIQWKAFMCHWARRRNKLKEHRRSRHKYRNKPSCASFSEGSRMLFVISLVLRHSTAPYECIGLHNL